MKHKAASPDAWLADHFLRLPTRFWAALSRLWKGILEAGTVPTAWCTARVVMGGGDGTRPINVTSMTWRICSTALLRSFGHWPNSWAPATSQGGLRHKAVHNVHAKLHFDLISQAPQNGDHGGVIAGRASTLAAPSKGQQPLGASGYQSERRESCWTYTTTFDGPSRWPEVSTTRGSEPTEDFYKDASTRRRFSTRSWHGGTRRSSRPAATRRFTSTTARLGQRDLRHPRCWPKAALQAIGSTPSWAGPRVSVPSSCPATCATTTCKRSDNWATRRFATAWSFWDCGTRTRLRRSTPRV